MQTNHLTPPDHAIERRGGNRPVLSDLRESGAIEQDADIVGLLLRPSFYAQESEPDLTSTALIIAKHRNGPTEIVELEFRKSLARFEGA